jgi:hypothetical protein
MRKSHILIPLLGIIICLGTWSPALTAQQTGKNVTQPATVDQKAGDQNVESSSGPQPLAKISEKDFKFSPVVEGTTVHHNYIIKNEGQATLHISKVKTG